MKSYEESKYYNVIVKRIEYLQPTATGILQFNLVCDFDTGYTIKKIRNSCNRNVTYKFCQVKTGDLINVKLRKAIPFEYTIFEDKPDYVCEEINIINP